MEKELRNLPMATVTKECTAVENPREKANTTGQWEASSKVISRTACEMEQGSGSEDLEIAINTKDSTSKIRKWVLVSLFGKMATSIKVTLSTISDKAMEKCTLITVHVSKGNGQKDNKYQANC